MGFALCVNREMGDFQAVSLSAIVSSHDFADQGEIERHPRPLLFKQHEKETSDA
jgi:hypothetical protein